MIIEKMDHCMPSTPILFELTANMGQALFRLQNAERVLKVTLRWLGADPDVTLAGLEARESQLQKKTLGMTLGLFKNQIPFADDFEVAMQEFIESRNLFVHDFLSLPGFSIRTDDEIAVGIEFLRKLMNQADLLTRVMQGLNQMFINRGEKPDSDEITDEKLNEMLALMMLRPSP